MDKRGLEFETLAKWIIGLIALVIVALGIVLLKSRGGSLINKIAEIFRFGR